MRLIPVVLILVAASVGSLSAQPPAPDPGAPGPYAVGHVSFTVIDPSRDTASPFGGRPVFVSAFYPVDPSDVTADAPGAVYPLDPFYSLWPVSHSSDWEKFGVAPAVEGLRPSLAAPFPVVLVSPGLGGRSFSLLAYALRLASHGFVVALAQHYHDGAYAWDPLDSIDIAMVNRPLDISLMLDAILARNGDPADLLFDTIRPDLVAASGHSFGGYAAMVLAGGDDVVCGSPEDPLGDTCSPVYTTRPDARIKAIVPLDGSSQLLHFSELQRITVPSMAVGEAWGSEMEDVQARQHAAITGDPSYRVDIRNTVHNSFAMGCTASRVLFSVGAISAAQLKSNLSKPQCTTALPQAETLRLAAQYAIAFLKTHLAGDTGYQRILTPGWALTRETDVEFFVTEKAAEAGQDEDWPGDFWYFPHQPGAARERAQYDAVRPLIVANDIE